MSFLSRSHGLHYLKTLTALSVLCGAAQAQTIDLKSSFAAAEANDPELSVSRAQPLIEQERLVQSRALIKPLVSANLSAGRSTLTSIQQKVDSANYSTSGISVNLRQPLYRPAALRSIKQSEINVNSSETLLRIARMELLKRLASSYFDVLQFNDLLQISKNEETALLTVIQAARAGFERGTGIKTDIDDAVTRLDLVKLNSLTLEQSANYALQNFLEITQFEQIPQLLPASLKKLSTNIPSPDKISQWREDMLSGNPEIYLTELRRDIARLELEKSSYNQYPSIDLTSQWSNIRNESPSLTNYRNKIFSIGLQANIPIYSGGSLSAENNIAAFELNKFTDQMTATRKKINLQFRNVVHQYQLALSRIAALRNSLRSANIQIKSNTMAFKAGERSVLDIINAESQARTIKADLVKSIYSSFNLRIELNNLVGIPPETTVEEINVDLGTSLSESLIGSLQ